MSAAAESVTMMFCACCGTAESGDIKLKNCDDCDLVKYCDDACRELHLPEHKAKCKKRAAELHDELLFKQPESSHFGDCPICCLPLPLDRKKSVVNSCCSKHICDGCVYANKKRENERKLQHTCPFCREVVPKTMEECFERSKKRVEANDPVAISRMAIEIHGQGDHKTASEYFTRAAALGDALAHYQLAILYRDGQGVEKNWGKLWHHMEESAIGGHPEARRFLGTVEGKNGNHDRANKHLIIAAKLGCGESIKTLKDLYKDGIVSKEDFAAALRGHQAAVDATKSPQREEAERVRWGI